MRDAHNMQKAYEGVWANTGASAEDTEVAGRTVSLGSLFDLYGVPACVDMVDVDVQASEYEFALGHKGIFHGNAALDLLSRRARRVHIGLHKLPKEAHLEQIEILKRKFEGRGWRVVWLFGVHREDTPFGPVLFGDGILSVINENPDHACGLTKI